MRERVCRTCGEDRPSEFRIKNPGYKCRACWRTHARERMRSLRTEMLAAYGGKCDCCGESNPKFLSLDHTFGDGASERKLFGGTTRLVIYLKSKGWPTTGYRLLCYNCNCSRGFYGSCHDEV